MRTNLIKARKAKGLTQKQVAEKIDICVRQYQKLEAGTSNGSIELWCKLKKLLNISIDCLLEQTFDTK